MPDVNGVNGHSESTAAMTTTLPPDLESTMIRQFDDLVAKGEIMWAPYTSEPIEDQGFKAVFQLAPHLLHKPIQPDTAPERKTGKGKNNPFLNPDPRFVVSHVKPYHTLLLNKYCVYRPSLILHTDEFAPQTDDLDADDLRAAWTVLNHFQHHPSPSSPSPSSSSPSPDDITTTTKNEIKYLLIYNCGIQAGSSQGHKHMQLWPYPPATEIGFDLFPDRVGLEAVDHIVDDVPSVPHKHFIIRFPPRTSSSTAKGEGGGLEHVVKAYASLLRRIRQCHTEDGSTAYNVVLTTDWLCLIPRRDCGIGRGAGSNAAGVLGLVWVSYEEEKEVWTSEPSLTEFLRFLGVPR